MPQKLNIGVVMGGPSSEHDISIMTGRNVIEGLRAAGHQPTAIYVAQNGNWFLGEKETAYDPSDICAWHDVMFNAMHGEFGEDGRVQQIFEHCGVPYTGSGVAASSLAINKIISREIFQKEGLSVPRAIAFSRATFNSGAHIQKIMQMASPPWIVKPASRGSSVGVTKARAYNDLPRAIEYAFSFDKNILAEECIVGREITCGVLEEFDGKRHYAFHPIEIIPPEGHIFDYDVKYDGSTKEVPAPFFGEMLRHIKETAVAAHTALGCAHYSRTDMIIKGTKIYVLETNTLPGLTKESLFPKAAALARLEFPQLLDHLVQLAAVKK